MKTFPLARKIFCIAAVLCTAAWNANANLVVDGGFEASADGPGPHPFSAAWTNVDPAGFSGVGGNPAFAHSGNNYAFLGETPLPGSLSQNLSTTAGTFYTLSFWLANDLTEGLPSTNSFEVFWNGASIFSLINAPVFPYTQFSFGVVATSGSTPLEFRYTHDNDFWRLDDVSVDVPESFSTIWLALPAFALLGLVHFRTRARKRVARV